MTITGIIGIDIIRSGYMRRKLQEVGPGLLLCLIIAALAWYLGRLLPVIGGPVFGILFGMAIAMLFP